MATKEFNIHVSMEERWIPHFQSFLKYMEGMGSMGHSAMVGFYADGDGDFRPRFTFDIPTEKVDGLDKKTLLKNHEDDFYKIEAAPQLIPEILFDAG